MSQKSVIHHWISILLSCERQNIQTNKKDKVLKIDHVLRFRWYRRRICSSHSSRNSNMVSNERSSEKHLQENDKKNKRTNKTKQKWKEWNEQSLRHFLQIASSNGRDFIASLQKAFHFFIICHKPFCFSSLTMEVRRHATVPDFGHLGGSKMCELFSTLLRPSSAKHVQPVNIPLAKRKKKHQKRFLWSTETRQGCLALTLFVTQCLHILQWTWKTGQTRLAASAITARLGKSERTQEKNENRNRKYLKMTQISPQEAQEKKAASPFFCCTADLLNWKWSREKKKNTTEKVRNHQKYVRKTAFFGIPKIKKRRIVTTSSQTCKRQKQRKTTHKNTSSEMSDTHSPRAKTETI